MDIKITPSAKEKLIEIGITNLKIVLQGSG
jgi:hypothetical protein